MVLMACMVDVWSFVTSKMGQKLWLESLVECIVSREFGLCDVSPCNVAGG